MTGVVIKALAPTVGAPAAVPPIAGPLAPSVSVEVRYAFALRRAERLARNSPNPRWCATEAARICGVDQIALSALLETKRLGAGLARLALAEKPKPVASPGDEETAP